MDGITIFLSAWMLMPVLLLAGWIISNSRLKNSLSKCSAKIAFLVEDLKLERAKGLALSERMSGIISIDDEISELNAQAVELRDRITTTAESYREKRETLKRLEYEVAVYDERLAFAELGVYEPHFDFGDSEAFKKAIREVRERQKTMVSTKTATLCPTDWTVGGSRAQGQTMVNRQTRLTLRAFNNECEAAIANTRWNNVVAMEKRVLNAAKQINTANSSIQLTLNEEYVALKIDELHLTHEYREQRKVERDERTEMARVAREEKKLQDEAEAAEREEAHYKALLDKARKEVGIDEARIRELESALERAHAEFERARAMAEMTRSGYVYIISNIGSFGDGVVKIGLTRRLDPDDRVRELGDASVPFGFDTHAIIYSDEAPTLEAALHREFGDRRVNGSNMRKEFFHATLDEVEAAVQRLAPDASFFKDREAQEWHETLARRNQMLSDMQLPSDGFPDVI